MSATIKKDGDIEVNLNSRVRFNLTPRGEKLYKQHVDEMNQKWQEEGGKDTLDLCLVKNADGYIEWSLWEFMSIFGKHMSLGADTVVRGNKLIFYRSKGE